MGEQKAMTMEQLLAAAAADEGFRAELLADRQAALRSRDIQLNETDAAMLASVPDEQLTVMLDKLAVGPIDASDLPQYASHGIRPERAQIKGIRPGRILLTAAAGTVLVGGALSLTAVRGSRPDRPIDVTQPLQEDAARAAPTNDAAPDDEEGDR